MSFDAAQFVEDKYAGPPCQSWKWTSMIPEIFMKRTISSILTSLYGSNDWPFENNPWKCGKEAMVQA